jgi:hypothetical protein
MPLQLGVASSVLVGSLLLLTWQHSAAVKRKRAVAAVAL